MKIFSCIKQKTLECMKEWKTERPKPEKFHRGTSHVSCLGKKASVERTARHRARCTQNRADHSFCVGFNRPKDWSNRFLFALICHYTE